MARCGAGWRGQHEDFGKALRRWLPAQRNRFGWSSIKQARGLLAGEGDDLRPVAMHLFPEGRDVDGKGKRLGIHARAGFAQIRKADAEFQERWKFARCVKARRYTDLLDRAPKAIAGMGVVVANIGRPRTCRGADEDQSKMLLKLIWKFFQRVPTLFVKSGDAENEWLFL